MSNAYLSELPVAVCKYHHSYRSVCLSVCLAIRPSVCLSPVKMRKLDGTFQAQKDFLSLRPCPCIFPGGHAQVTGKDQAHCERGRSGEAKEVY